MTGAAGPDELQLRRQRPLGIFVRGMAMGAADVVPGVSGGTLAFITGIYFRLLAAVSALPAAFIRYLIKGQVRNFWQASDAGFLLCLVAGILASIASLASVITHALTHYPVLIWSFFFGLILASVWHVGRQVRRFRLTLLWPFVLGFVLAWGVTSFPGSQLSPSPAAFFGAGALAICAMILPGISGSFILVIIGMYTPVLMAIRDVDLWLLTLFLAGCVLGLLSVARLISWAFQHFHDPVLVLLTGFMAGSLNKVWPWREVISWRTNRAGEQVPLHEVNVSPEYYQALTGQDPMLVTAITLAVAGMLTVLIIEWLGTRSVLPREEKKCFEK